MKVLVLLSALAVCLGEVTKVLISFNLSELIHLINVICNFLLLISLKTTFFSRMRVFLC